MDELNCKTVGIIGTGIVGSGWAAFYAIHGMRVKLYDRDRDIQDRGLARTLEYIDHLRDSGLAGRTEAEEARKNLNPVGNISELADRAELVHESTSEYYEVKKEVFSILDEACSPSTIIASSSSGLLITELQKVMKHPERSLIAHPFNPPHLIPLVELVPGAETDPEIIRKLYDFYKGLGKIPVVLKKEVPGHIANRLATALWREAIDLVASGVASVEDVDKALYAGPGLRWAFMGQHLIYHLGGGEGGYDHFIEHLGKGIELNWKSMATWTEIPAEAREAVVQGLNDFLSDRDEDQDQNQNSLTRWRDEKLVKILKAVYEED